MFHWIKSNKITLVLALLLTIVSLIAFYQYDNSLYGKISSTGTAMFVDYGDGTSSVTFNGYVKWNNSNNQPNSMKQYFHVKAAILKNGYDCTILDVWEWAGNVLIDGAQKCEVVKFLVDEKIAIIKWNNLVFTSTPQAITFVDTKEVGEQTGILIPSYKIKY